MKKSTFAHMLVALAVADGRYTPPFVGRGHFPSLRPEPGSEGHELRLKKGEAKMKMRAEKLLRWEAAMRASGGL